MQDDTIRVSLQDLILLVLSSDDAEYMHSAYYSCRQIQSHIADKLLKHPQFTRVGHIEWRIDKYTAKRVPYLWFKKDWHSTYRQEQIRKKEAELRGHKLVTLTRRFENTLDSVIKAYPKLAVNKRLAADLIRVWLEDEELYIEQLQKHSYYEGVDEDSAEFEQLKKDLEAFIESTKEKPYL